MYSIVKRDGSHTEFHIQKIQNAIEKAFIASGHCKNDELIQLLSLRTCADMEKKVVEDCLQVEEIQDSVEKVLSESGFSDVAKAFILYRKQREKARSIQSALQGYKQIVDEYLHSDSDNEKSGVGGLILRNSAAITKNYWLNEIYDQEIAQAHIHGDIHIHGISMLTAYSAGWSLRDFLQNGIASHANKTTWPPAKTFAQLCAQVVNILGILQNEWSGAQSLNSFDTYAAAYVKAEKLEYAEIKASLATMIYSLNMPSRWGAQIPFLQFNFDWDCPRELQKEKCFIAAQEKNFTYGDCQTEMNLINRAFIELMLQGDGAQRGFQYPIPSYPLRKVVNDEERSAILFQLTAKYGTPYFCDEQAETTEKNLTAGSPLDYHHLYQKTGGYFGYLPGQGTIGIVSLNLPRLAYISRNEEIFFSHLDHEMALAGRALNQKREIIEKSLQSGLYPYTSDLVSSFSSYFSTIGIVGMNEACLNAAWVQTDLHTEKAQNFALKCLERMRKNCLKLQEEYHQLFSLEATPAEKTSYRLAKEDVKHYPNIITASNDKQRPYYTNSSQLPVNYEGDVFMALDLQAPLQKMYTSGTVFHVFMEEELPDWQSCYTLVRKISEHYSLPNITISPTYSVCPVHGYWKGEKRICPLCGKENEVWSRVSGYYRPVKNWNEGKQKEYHDRRLFTARTALLKGKDLANKQE